MTIAAIVLAVVAALVVWGWCAARASGEADQARERALYAKLRGKD